MTINLIVAYSTNLVIGNGLDLPWKIPSDLKYFKKMTEGHPIIMGRKTWDSLKRKALPNRTNIVISRTLQPDDMPEGVLVFEDVTLAINYIKKYIDCYELFIIGGGELYKQTIELADYIYATEVEHIVEENEQTIYFPKLDQDLWFIESKSIHFQEIGDEYKYRQVIYCKNTFESAETNDIYCKHCSSCGEEGCCNPVICDVKEDGLYCQSNLLHLKSGYSSLNEFYGWISEFKESNDNEIVTVILDKLNDICKKNDEKYLYNN